jgi:hypothetical protein
MHEPLTGAQALPHCGQHRVGKQFTAYVLWMGAIKPEKHREWMFARNGFDSSSQEASPQKVLSDDKPQKKF